MAEPVGVAFLYGSDEFAISAAIEKLCASAGEGPTADMNITRMDGRAGLDLEAFNTAVNAVPFLAPRRVVVLLHPGTAFSTPEKRKGFQELLGKLPPTTTMVLAEFGELKGDHWLLKWTASGGKGVNVHPYNLPRRWELPRWIEAEAKKQGGSIEPDAAARLAELVGEDTRVGALELTKLLTYVNYERPITMADVEKVCLDTAQGSIFELVDALGQGDGRRAQHMLHKLLETEDPSNLWGMVIRQFRLILQARELLEINAGPAQIKSKLGVHEYVAQKVTNQARRFSLPALEAIYHKLLEIDEAAKTSRVPLDLSLDALVVELAGHS